MEMGNKTEQDFISTQKKLEAITILEQNEGDANNPIFLREELSKILYMLANESIEKERVKKKMKHWDRDGTKNMAMVKVREYQDEDGQ